jgi:hypothetical protein
VPSKCTIVRTVGYVSVGSRGAQRGEWDPEQKELLKLLLCIVMNDEEVYYAQEPMAHRVTTVSSKSSALSYLPL